MRQRSRWRVAGRVILMSVWLLSGSWLEGAQGLNPKADGANKACSLLTAEEVEAALGAKVSGFTEGPAAFCHANSPTVTVTLRLAKKGGAPGREAKGIEMAKQMGAQVDVKKFGATTCSTLVPPASMVQAMGYNTTCSVDKGDSVAAVEVTVKNQADMVSIEKLRPLAEKMSARF